MDNKISTQTKKELVRILGIQYRESSKMGKAQILDQFIVVNGYRNVRYETSWSDESYKISQ